MWHRYAIWRHGRNGNVWRRYSEGSSKLAKEIGDTVSLEKPAGFDKKPEEPKKKSEPSEKKKADQKKKAEARAKAKEEKENKDLKTGEDKGTQDKKTGQEKTNDKVVKEKYTGLQGVEFPKGTPHKKGAVLELTTKEAESFADGLIEKEEEL